MKVPRRRTLERVGDYAVGLAAVCYLVAGILQRTNDNAHAAANSAVEWHKTAQHHGGDDQ